VRHEAIDHRAHGPVLQPEDRELPRPELDRQYFDRQLEGDSDFDELRRHRPWSMIPLIEEPHTRQVHCLHEAGKINMASAGSGTPNHMAGELFKMMTDIEMVHVPYRGDDAPAIAGLLGGQMQVYFGGLTGSIAYIRGGKLRASGDDRNQLGRAVRAADGPVISCRVTRRAVGTASVRPKIRLSTSSRGLTRKSAVCRPRCQSPCGLTRRFRKAYRSGNRKVEQGGQLRWLHGGLIGRRLGRDVEQVIEKSGLDRRFSPICHDETACPLSRRVSGVSGASSDVMVRLTRDPMQTLARACPTDAFNQRSAQEVGAMRSWIGGHGAQRRVALGACGRISFFQSLLVLDRLLLHVFDVERTTVVII
jgi:hypothetical protein